MPPPPASSFARPRRQPDALPRGWPAWPYVLPMAVFVGTIQLAGYLGDAWYAPAYVFRTVAVAGLLVWLWPWFQRVRWTHLGLGVLAGVVGTVQWVGMESLLQAGREATAPAGDAAPSLAHTVLVWTTLAKFDDPGRALPDLFASAWAFWLFVAVRWAGSAVVVPVMEELFWRDWLWRTVAAPNDYTMAEVGEYDRGAFWLVPLAFALVHVQWLTAIAWALLIAWLLVRTRSLGACVVAHATTNLLLGGYVLAMWKLGRPVWWFW